MKSVDRNLKALGQEMAIIRAKGKEWGNSTEGLTAKQAALSTLMESQDVKVRKLNEAYEKAVREQGANSAAAENLAIKLNRATAEITRTQNELEQVNEELQRQQQELADSESSWGRLSASVETAGDTLTNAGEKMSEVGGTLSATITAPLLALGAGAMVVAGQFDEAAGRIQSGLGLTADESKELEGIAKSLWENGFGEDVNAAADAVVQVSKNLAKLPTDQLEKITGYAGVLADRFEIDIAQSTNAAGMVMEAFGGTAEEAFDLMTYGLQNAKGDGGELLDVFNEYAPQFKALGYSAEGFMATLIEGSQSGAFNFDLLGDAAKESFLIMGEGSDDVKAVLKDVGLDAGKVIDGINSGGKDAQKSFMAVSAAISGIKDPTEKTAAAIALFGTPIEDLGPQFQGFFSQVEQDLKGVEGSTQRAGDALYDNFGARVQTEFRKFQSALEPAGEILLDVAEEWLPKLATAAEDALQWFEDLGPEGQKTALAIGAVAAAAGPALVVVGGLASGLGAMAGIVSPLIATLGTAGLAGSFVALANPIGLTVAGVGLLTAAVGLAASASKESNDVNLETLDAKQKEIAKNDELIASYEGLRSKNELSNEQMLRFLDIQAQLESTTAPERVAALKDEQALLLEKSTLTNDEMDNFLGLNADIIAAAPDTVKAISSEGEAFALNTIAIKELNAEKAKELEAGAYQLVVDSLGEENKLRKDSINLVKEAQEAEIELQANKQIQKITIAEIAAQQEKILDLENQKVGASLEEITALDRKIRQEQEILYEKQSQNEKADHLIEKYGKQYTQRQEALDANREELAQLEQAQFKYEQIILAQAGITAEKGRGGEQLNQELSKLETQKSKLSELLSKGKINTAEYQEQNGKIETQISKLQRAKGELELINIKAGKTVYKDVKINESPANFWDTLDEKLRRPITKTVSIRYNNMNGPQEPGFATGTRYAPGGMSWVGEQGPELMYVPTGARVIPNDDSQRLLNKWNIPSEGTSKQQSQSQSTQGNESRSLTIQIPLNGQVIAEQTLDANQLLFGSASKNSSWLSGVKI